MINKTSSIPFLKFGEVFDYHYFDTLNDANFTSRFLDVTNKSVNMFIQSDKDFYVRAIKGCVILLITPDINSSEYHEFMIHRTAKIKAGTLFNYVAVSDNCEIEAKYPNDVKLLAFAPENNYVYKELVPSFRVNRILSYYYSIRSSDYIAVGEKNSDWELTFVDNGSLHTTIDDKEFDINEYDLILYSPGQYHSQAMIEGNSSSYLTIIFNMDTAYPKLFANTVFHANREVVKIINAFVKATNENDFFTKDLLICYLQEALIQLVRTGSDLQTKMLNDESTPMKQQFENELLDEILLYISENIRDPLSIQDLCNKFSLSRSSLQLLFNNNLNISPKQYISNRKLKKSKELIKTNKYTISEISNMIGFSSIHYFSRVFKEKYGITPTDYAKTIYQ